MLDNIFLCFYAYSIGVVISSVINESFVIVFQVLQLSMLNIAQLHLLDALKLALKLCVDRLVGRAKF